MKLTAILFGLAMLAAAAYAEVHQITVGGTCRTNATAGTLTTLTANGTLRRAVLTINTGNTSDVMVVDNDGTVIISNGATVGTVILTNFASPEISGAAVKTLNANTNAATLNLKLTLDR